MIGQVSNVGIETCAARVPNSGRVEQHRKWGYAEEVAVEILKRTYHRRGKVRATADGFGEDHVRLVACKLRSSGNELRETATEAALGHFAHQIAAGDRVLCIDEPRVLVIYDDCRALATCRE